MQLKDMLLKALSAYFILVTLITAAVYIIGIHADPAASFGYEAFARPLIYAALSLLPIVVTFSSRELSIKELLFRKLIQLILIEVIMLPAVFQENLFQKKHLAETISVSASVLVIFIIVNVIDWIRNNASAKKLTEELMRYQEKGQ